ncbi:MAG: hypothetical protein ACKOE8_12370, partial [Opitutaceae bacterium]
MKAALVLALPLAATVVLAQTPPEPTEPPRSSAREALRARAAEDAKKAPAAKPAASAPANRPPAASTAPATTATPSPAASESGEATTAKTDGEKSTTTVLPKMEVRKGKFSERDYKLAQDLHKQDQEIEREKRNLKVSETDAALNNAKVSSALSIFGGESAQYRKRVAAERVEL